MTLATPKFRRARPGVYFSVPGSTAAHWLIQSQARNAWIIKRRVGATYERQDQAASYTDAKRKAAVADAKIRAAAEARRELTEQGYSIRVERGPLCAYVQLRKDATDDDPGSFVAETSCGLDDGSISDAANDLYRSHMHLPRPYADWQFTNAGYTRPQRNGDTDDQ